MNIKKYVFTFSYYPEYELKGKIRVFFKQLFYILKTGEINQDYFVYGFDRKNKIDFKNYVPKYLFTNARHKKNQRPLKPCYGYYNYLCLLRDKFVFEAFCNGIGIYTPSNIGFIKNREFCILKTKSIVSLDCITNYEIDAFCKRNVSYGGGSSNDVFKLKISNGEIFKNQTKIDIPDFEELIGNDNWIIQDRIKNQNFEYAKFHNESINTIRIVTINNGSEINILYAILRMGANCNFVDNWSSGGILVGIDIKNGTLEKWGFQKPGYGSKIDRHPNSGIIFKEQHLSNWHEIVKYVKKAHKFFYGLHSIGWDVATTDEGIMIIEGNDNWDTSGAQFYSGAKDNFNKYFK